MKLLLSLSIFLQTSFALAVSCEELNLAWQNKYHSDLHVSWARENFHCPSNMSKIAEAVYHLDHTVFSPEILGEEPGFYGWFTSIITKTVYTPKHDSHPLGAASSLGGTLWIHDIFFNQELEWRTGALVHEARHSQPGDPSHVKCTQGDSKGQLSCDKQFFGGEAEGSGYNFEFRFHWWIKDAAKQTDLKKSVSTAHMKYLLLNRFNEVKNEDLKKFGF